MAGAATTGAAAMGAAMAGAASAPMAEPVGAVSAAWAFAKRVVCAASVTCSAAARAVGSALAMGEPGLTWLSKIATDGYDSAVVTDDGRAFSSANLPAAV